MAFWDFLKPSLVNKNETRQVRQVSRRHYAAANQGRLFEDFKASNRSADTEIRPALVTMRNRARDLARNDPYAKRFLNLMAAEPAKDPVVKKSDAGICHDVSSSSFNNTKKFTAFNSLEECVKSGGKLPAGKTLPVVEVVKKSEAGICHDKSSASYEQTKKFTEFKSLDECLKSGGKLPKK